ncbi:MAG: nucleoside deaminase [Alphaproteobacteria bacterium]|nr:nucleoside deaminase [Alphaproteobacteria bacterium]
MDRNEFMRAAIALAEKNVADGVGGPFGAVIVRDGEIVGRGTNLVTSSNDPTAHAEVVAIRDACTTLGTFNLQGCEVYTSCEPCPMCLSAIYWARLDRIFYGNTKADAAEIDFDDAFLYDEIPLPLNKRAIPTEQMLHDESIKAFQAWAVSEDKVPY